MVSVLDMQKMSLPALKRAMQAEFEQKFDEIVEKNESNADIFLSFLRIEFSKRINVADRTTEIVVGAEELLASTDVFVHWARMPKWSSKETAALLAGIDPDRLKYDIERVPELAASAPGITKMKRISQILKRYDYSASISPDSYLSPSEVLSWASRFKVEVPEPLASAVAAMWDEPILSNAVDRPLGTKERNNLLRMIAGLAKEAKYDISEGSGAASSIEAAVVAAGFDGPKEKTVREILRQVRQVD